MIRESEQYGIWRYARRRSAVIGRRSDGVEHPSAVAGVDRLGDSLPLKLRRILPESPQLQRTHSGLAVWQGGAFVLQQQVAGRYLTADAHRDHIDHDSHGQHQGVLHFHGLQHYKWLTGQRTR